MPSETPSLDRAHSSHPRHWRQFRVVYPVMSRRSGGLSVGINLSPDGLCNFDCTYCQVDRSKLAENAPVDLDELHGELSVMLGLIRSGDFWTDPDFEGLPEDRRVLRDLSFSGNGEPTASPLFPAAVDMVLGLRDASGLDGVKVVVITNGTLLHREPVKKAIGRLGDRGEVWAKLDAGTQAYYEKIDRSAVPLERSVGNMVQASQVHPLTIQTMLLRDSSGPMPDTEFMAYIARLRTILDRGGVITGVQLYTVAREPQESDVEPLTEEELEQRAAQLRDALPELDVRIYP
ncbi:radical SAM protein [Mucisphaera calidilacus]|uniref:Radical SAM protein n=1 Tax=Mucisphaera calidilacus TaxID=2527982 RepID=A0A518C0Z9_9BACT|nr:radical SAM protein [Mucisphaera calidilacus]QDU72901.1 hypothetical protein Pan265_27770 [Mucisphaera calidilacus]